MTTNQDDQLAPAETTHRPGMGALPYGEGTAFRVWAPHADAVCVMGDFNGWDEQSVAMVSEGNGNWYADVPGAQVGHGYKYVLLDHIDRQVGVPVHQSLERLLNLRFHQAAHAE